jgi:hypothetical protein
MKQAIDWQKPKNCNNFEAKNADQAVTTGFISIKKGRAF